jgi:hypothetical protein
MVLRHKWLLSVALATAFGAGGAAVASGLPGSAAKTVRLARTVHVRRSTSHQVRRSGDVTPAGIAPSLYADFAVFRRGTHTYPSLPQSVLEDVSSRGPSGSTFGLDVAGIQYVVDGASFQAWLVPGTSGACMIWSEPFLQGLPGRMFRSSCASVDALLSGRFGAVELGPGSTQTRFGLVPDGNNNVTAVRHDGTAETVAVVDNVIYATSTTGFSDFQIRDASGALQTVGPAGNRVQ